MAKQPEGKLSTRIMKEWRKRGSFCFKVWGNEFQMSGIPDISGTYQGFSIWCETKMPGNKPSKIQDFRISQIRDAGGLVVVGYSVKDATDLLDHIDSGHTPDCDCIYLNGNPDA